MLTELGWKPTTLARRLNSFAALHGRSERVHAKTPYKWLRGDRPAALPWPAVLAELGRLITPADLGWDGDDIGAVSAISGLVLRSGRLEFTSPRSGGTGCFPGLMQRRAGLVEVFAPVLGACGGGSADMPQGAGGDPAKSPPAFTFRA